jgi:hypothetical protein
VFSKSLILIWALSYSFNSYAILDFLAEEGKDAAEVAAYAGALADLVMEINPDSSAKEHSRDLNSRINAVQREIRDFKTVGESTKSLLEGPQLGNKRVLDNIRSLTMYLRRLKVVMGMVGALGTQGSIAINTAETNRHLSEIQKNQQTQMLLLTEAQVSSAEKELEQKKAWKRFLRTEQGKQKKYALRKH